MGLCWDGLFQSSGWRFLDRRRTLLRTLIHDVFRLDCPGGHFEPPDPPPPDPDFNDLNHDHKNAYYVDTHGYPWMSMENNGNQWISIHFHAFPWMSMDIHGYWTAARGKEGAYDFCPAAGSPFGSCGQQWSMQDFQQRPPQGPGRPGRQAAGPSSPDPASRTGILKGGICTWPYIYIYILVRTRAFNAQSMLVSVLGATSIRGPAQRSVSE